MLFRSLGTASLIAETASFPIASLAGGTHTITARYEGSACCTASTSAVITQVVSSTIGTTTSLAVTPAVPVTGQKITLTATVVAVNPGSGTPSGSVIFRDGTVNLATVSLSGGRASRQVVLAVGNHALSAQFVPKGTTYGGSTGAASVTVLPANTTTTLTTSKTPSSFGQRVTFTAMVGVMAPGAGTPTGTVTFRDGNTVLAQVSVVKGRATYTTASLARGSHAITATYSGDTAFASSTSPQLTQQVN